MVDSVSYDMLHAFHSGFFSQPDQELSSVDAIIFGDLKNQFLVE